MSTKKAQGLNASIPATITVKSGSETLATATVPSKGNVIVAAEGSAAAGAPAFADPARATDGARMAS
jgi:hypothetical protein